MGPPSRCRLDPSIALVAILFLGLGLSACSRGPETGSLQTELQRRLDSRFEEGLFSVVAFHRRGSAPFHDLEKALSGLFVYYDARIEFQRDHDLVSWQGLNVGTLAYVLGANEAGVEGITAGGNRAGDELRVRGRMAWERAATDWRPIAVEPPPELEARPLTAEGVGPGRVLADVRSLVEKPRKVAPGSVDAAILAELGDALDRIDRRLARIDGKLVLGTGQVPGTYSEFGAAFARYATEKGLPYHAEPSQGSVENAFALQSGLIDFGLIQSDVAESMYKGISDQQVPLPRLRGVASLWPEAVHVVTLESSGIRHFADLRGRRVAMGSLGSGTRINAVQFSRASELGLTAFASIHDLRSSDAIDALEAGEVDAIFLTEAVPSRLIQSLTSRRDDIRFVNAEESVLRRLSTEHFAFYGMTIPVHSYPGQEEPIRTLGLAAAIVTHVDARDEDVTRTLTLLLEQARDATSASYRAGFVSEETIGLGIALPLHPAAERFHRERTQEAAADADAAAPASPTPASPPARSDQTPETH